MSAHGDPRPLPAARESHPQASPDDRPTKPVVIGGIGQLREALSHAASKQSSVALVPTMGALHAGHLALVARAAQLADLVVVSIFVNPLQFGANEDLDNYPKTLEADVSALSSTQADLVFAPTVAEMYPDGQATTRITAGPVGALYEGRSRPGHFDGVLTVVDKLLNIVGPDVVLFGQKDAQQVFLVTRMVRDLNIACRVETVATVREPDGLALSSRNRFLDAGERDAALVLSGALRAAASASENGVQAARRAGGEQLAGNRLVRLDYLDIVHPDTFLPVDDDHRGPARVLVAAYVGTTRLIDNEIVVVGSREH